MKLFKSDKKEKKFKKDLLMSEAYNIVLEEFNEVYVRPSACFSRLLKMLLGTVISLVFVLLISTIGLFSLFLGVLVVDEAKLKSILTVFVVLIGIIIVCLFILLIILVIVGKKETSKNQTKNQLVFLINNPKLERYIHNLELLRELILEIEKRNNQEFLRFKGDISLISNLFSITIVASFIGYSANQNNNFWNFFLLIWIIFLSVSFVYLYFFSSVLNEDVKNFFIKGYKEREVLCKYLQEALHLQLIEDEKQENIDDMTQLLLDYIDKQDVKLENIRNEIADLNYLRKWRNKLK